MKKIRIAHFSIPFYNGGGMVKYVKDIAELQMSDDKFEYVCIFMPGHYTLLKKKPAIVRENFKSIDLFNINNFNPDTLLEGTKYPLKSIKNIELENIILDKLISLKINIVHFHTFFGLSSNLIKKIKSNNIKIVYTAHDYQPLCTKITLLDKNSELCIEPTLTNCVMCNLNSLSEKKAFFRYSKISNKLKKFDKIKSKVKYMVVQCQKNNVNNKIISLENQGYIERRNSFVKNLNKYCDLIIFSSEITHKIFQSFGIYSNNFKIIPISNLNITDDIYDYDVKLESKKYRFGYLGGDRPEKGYKHMINSFEKLNKEGIENWELIIYGKGAENIKFNKEVSTNIIIKGHSEDNVYNEFDILLVPSIWPETFNFVVLEGLSNQKLVIASDIVGSADLYKQNGIITYKYNNEDDLIIKLKDIINNKRLYRVNISFNDYSKNLKFNNHANIINDIYKSILYYKY